jgi:hypothetical protein
MVQTDSVDKPVMSGADFFDASYMSQRDLQFKYQELGIHPGKDWVWFTNAAASQRFIYESEEYKIVDIAFDINGRPVESLIAIFRKVTLVGASLCLINPQLRILILKVKNHLL